MLTEDILREENEVILNALLAKTQKIVSNGEEKRHRLYKDAMDMLKELIESLSKMKENRPLRYDNCNYLSGNISGMYKRGVFPHCLAVMQNCNDCKMERDESGMCLIKAIGYGLQDPTILVGVLILSCKAAKNSVEGSLLEAEYAEEDEDAIPVKPKKKKRKFTPDDDFIIGPEGPANMLEDDWEIPAGYDLYPADPPIPSEWYRREDDEGRAHIPSDRIVQSFADLPAPEGEAEGLKRMYNLFVQVYKYYLYEIENGRDANEALFINMHRNFPMCRNFMDNPDLPCDGCYLAIADFHRDTGDLMLGCDTLITTACTNPATNIQRARTIKELLMELRRRIANAE